MAVYFDHDDTPLERSTFVRNSEYFVIDRITLTAVVLTLSGAAPQIMRFAEPLDALFFANDLESALGRMGWSLVKCEPIPTAERPAEAWHNGPTPTGAD